MPKIPKDTCAGVFLPLKVQVGLMDKSTAVSPTALFITKSQRNREYFMPEQPSEGRLIRPPQPKRGQS